MVTDKPTRSEAPLKVLFIVGFTRSGSTILSNVLGELPGFFNGGEIQSSYWRKGAMHNAQCGCGRSFAACEIWREISEAAFGGHSRQAVDAEEVTAIQHKLMRNRNLPRILRLQSGSPTGDRTLDLYLDRTARLYRTVGSITGARVIVDSSKWAPFAAVTRLVPDIVPYFVHLIRDPRAIAHSWRRQRAGMETLRPPQAVYQWSKWNLASLAVMSRVPSSRALVLRYEDFASFPKQALTSVARLVGEPVEPEEVLTGPNRVRLGENHTLWGNPSRFARDTVDLRPDDAWRDAMPAAERRLVSAMAGPALAALSLERQWSRRQR